MTDGAESLSRLTLEERALLEQQLLDQPATDTPAEPNQDQSPQALSFAQESLWFFDQLVPNSPLYNMPQAFLLRGRLDLDVLERAFAALLGRHPALRTRFLSTEAGP